MVTAKNNEENYAELLARYIEEQLGRNDDKEKDYV